MNILQCSEADTRHQDEWSLDVPEMDLLSGDLLATMLHPAQIAQSVTDLELLPKQKPGIRLWLGGLFNIDLMIQVHGCMDWGWSQ